VEVVLNGGQIAKNLMVFLGGEGCVALCYGYEVLGWFLFVYWILEALLDAIRNLCYCLQSFVYIQVLYC
jgi:hypothetical protein